MRGTAHAWTPPYSEESIQAGKVRDAARDAAFFNSSRVADSFPESCIFRFRGGA
jgi:hypothetical protein